ncbi:MAG: sigma-54-dependent Fis family transcriptional regulator [Bacteroidetes bacterium]|nr:sigma-54-dependent Fis family transcriptional regulator [Bacteroidota bacterium]
MEPLDRKQFQKKYGIIGSSLEIQEVVQIVQHVAPTDITVLITGESGVGKEIVAQAIHNAGNRSKKEMVTVNCGAIPEGIIESELFGHEKGSFTGAVGERKGYFELADGGTIFLDEIGELPPATQVKFLRILENGEFLRVGSSVARKVDVRVIAATNKDLEQEVRNGNFRQDLYYRLRSVNIRIPPLRDRREDIPELFEKFVAEFSERNNIPFNGITPEAMTELQNYYWQGNVRELRNVVESMLVIERGKKIEVDDVRRYLHTEHSGAQRMLPALLQKHNDFDERQLILRALIDMKADILELKNMIASISGEGHPLSDHQPVMLQPGVSVKNIGSSVPETLSIGEMERRMIENSLKKYHGNRRLAANELKISERTLYRKIKEYNLS